MALYGSILFELAGDKVKQVTSDVRSLWPSGGDPFAHKAEQELVLRFRCKYNFRQDKLEIEVFSN